MKANMSLDYFGHERVHRAAASRNIVQHHGTFRFLVERPLNGLNLAPDSPDTIEQLLFFFSCMSHNIMSYEKLRSDLDKYTPPGIA